MDVVAFLTGITTAASVMKGAVETRDEQKIRTATNELNVQLTHFAAEVLAMQKEGVQAAERESAALTRIRDLEERLRELEKRNRDFSRYELVEPYTGTFVLVVKEASRDGEPSHYLCPGCRDNRGMKSILQFRSDEKRLAECPECTKTYRFSNDAPLRVGRRAVGVDDWMS